MALIFRHVHIDAKSVLTFVMSVRLSCKSEAPTGQISMKLGTFIKNLSRKSEFG